MLEEKLKEKTPYVTPEMDITIFSGEDVIATSGLPSSVTHEEWQNWSQEMQEDWIAHHGHNFNCHKNLP